MSYSQDLIEIREYTAEYEYIGILFFDDFCVTHTPNPGVQPVESMLKQPCIANVTMSLSLFLPSCLPSVPSSVFPSFLPSLFLSHAIAMFKAKGIWFPRGNCPPVLILPSTTTPSNKTKIQSSHLHEVKPRVFPTLELRRSLCASYHTDCPGLAEKDAAYQENCQAHPAAKSPGPLPGSGLNSAWMALSLVSTGFRWDCICICTFVCASPGSPAKWRISCKQQVLKHLNNIST